MNIKNLKFVVLLLVSLLIGAAIAYFLVWPAIDDSPSESKPQETVSPAPEESNPILSFDKNRYPLDEPSSIWVVINKQRPLPATFVPALTDVRGASLQPETAQAVERLIRAASDSQVSLRIISAYRSYDSQKSVYSSYVQKDGQAAADTYSARPGHSEHQTGLAVDLGNGSGHCDLETCFATTAGGVWLAANAHTYGFTIRYPEDKTNVTGYQYEPWHIRYVGVDLANELRAKNQVMEEFFGLPAAPSY